MLRSKSTWREPQAILEDVAKVVATALEAEHPRFRYTAGLTAKMGHFMRGKVPTSIVRKIGSWYLGLSQVRW